MNLTQIEQLNSALSDEAILLKNLDLDAYMGIMTLKKTLKDAIDESVELQTALIQDYKKEAKKDSPPIKFENNMLHGPIDFIQKIKDMRDLERDILTGFVDKAAFKAAFENAKSENQTILFEHLIK